MPHLVPNAVDGGEAREGLLNRPDAQDLQALREIHGTWGGDIFIFPWKIERTPLVGGPKHAREARFRDILRRAEPISSRLFCLTEKKKRQSHMIQTCYVRMPLDLPRYETLFRDTAVSGTWEDVKGSIDFTATSEWNPEDSIEGHDALQSDTTTYACPDIVDLTALREWERAGEDRRQDQLRAYTRPVQRRGTPIGRTGDFFRPPNLPPAAGLWAVLFRLAKFAVMYEGGAANCNCEFRTYFLRTRPKERATVAPPSASPGAWGGHRPRFPPVATLLHLSRRMAGKYMRILRLP